MKRRPLPTAQGGNGGHHGQRQTSRRAALCSVFEDGKHEWKRSRAVVSRDGNAEHGGGCPESAANPEPPCRQTASAARRGAILGRRGGFHLDRMQSEYQCRDDGRARRSSFANTLQAIQTQAVWRAIAAA